MNQEVLQITIAKISALAALLGSFIGALATLASTWLGQRLREWESKCILPTGWI